MWIYTYMGILNCGMRGGVHMTWAAAAISLVMLAYFIYLTITD